MGKSRGMAVGSAVAAWAILVGVGIREIHGHEATAGLLGAAPAHWPSASQLPRTPGFTVAMFVHPDCPCTRASLSELAAVAEQSRQPVLVVFPKNEPSPAWDRAGTIRNARRVIDRDGSEAQRFGAATSGHVVVYDAAGALRFSGGITGARGHAGKNVGGEQLAKILAGGSGHAEHAVFGCALEAVR
jgi:hypothetical protein